MNSGTRANSNYMTSSTPVISPSRFQVSSSSNMGLNNNLYIPNHQFTFGSPTQSPIITSSQQQCGANTRGIFMNRMSAPGIGTSWQHTVPLKMPWSESSTSMQFTSTPITSISVNSLSSSTSAGSSSRSHHKVKRHHHVNQDNDAPPNKQFISEERMANSMKNLCISPSSFFGKENQMPDHGWGKFLEVEERLKDEENIEEITVNQPSTLLIDESVKDSILKPRPILPLEVLNTINKPSLEVVLWKPPDGTVEEILNEVREKKQHQDVSVNPNYSSFTLDNIENSQKELSTMNADDDNNMEVEMFDTLDDNMVL